MLSLSLLVLIHEFGHFIFARIFKVRVEKFYLFFDPWFSLFKFKPKNSETEYGVGCGVLFTFLLALFIYSMILFTWGDTYMPLKNMKMGMDYSDTFKQIGFKDGDILLKADTLTLDRFGEDCLRSVIESKNVTVLRNGVETVIPIPDDMMQRLLRDKKGFAALRFPMVVKELPEPNAPAALAGMQAGDSIDLLRSGDLFG